MTKKLFFAQDTKLEGEEQAYSAGNVYEVTSLATSPEVRAHEQHRIERLLATGQAHEINFPTLEALEHTLASVVKDHERAKSSLHANPRFRDNAGELEYQLEQLEVKFEEDVARTKEGYAKELELQERELALKAVTEVHQTDEQTARFLNSTVAQLAYSDNPVVDMQLLRIKVNAMNEVQKATVLAQAGAIKQAINGNEDAEKVFAEIVNIAKQSNKASALDLQLRQLQALKAHPIDTTYDLYKRAVAYGNKTNVRGN